ncbi:MAG: sugar phosphate isomerase/epimerase [Verrucomicrobiota bacterium]|nr:sugar phosphate isomerase/epimerase [Verrucomicrobiota bacterium]
MKKQQVAAQLYTIRDYLQTPVEIAKSMKKIRDMGYKAVQVSGMGPIENAELVKILDGEDLVCCATHEPGDMIINEPEKVVDKLKALNTKYTAFPHPGSFSIKTEDDVKKLAAQLNNSGQILYENGLVLTYHNHDCEFAKVNGKLILDILYNETDPRYLQGEPDTFWVQSGGQDSAMWCEKLAGRLPLLHMKDYGVIPGGGRKFEEIGRGNLDWKGIIDAAEKASCEWFIVEQDGDWFDNDPFKSLEISLQYIEENLICTI